MKWKAEILYLKTIWWELCWQDTFISGWHCGVNFHYLAIPCKYCSHCAGMNGKSSERTWQDKRTVPRISISICKWTKLYTGTIRAYKDPWCLSFSFPVGQCDRYVWTCSPLLSLMNNTLTCHYFGCWVQQWINYSPRNLEIEFHYLFVKLGFLF